ncbi:MAG: permease prefix domain 1-containing protein [Chloroflexota bacterium]|nr:permease prefix domain 1-containing protein [Chloroflexota bacterium]
MGNSVNPYLDGIRSNLRLDPRSEEEIVREMYTHLEERVGELKDQGLSEEEAVRIATRDFGLLRSLAREVNEVHSIGRWSEAFLGAFPHLVIAILFALGLWQNLFCLILGVATIGIVVTYGWIHSKPTWFFSWLGYALTPFILVGLFLFNEGLTTHWVWLISLVYLPFALWLLISVGMQTLRRDWLMDSLMWFPLPTLIGWFLATQLRGGVSLQDFAPGIAISFLIMAAIVAVFIRSGKRIFRIGMLLIASVVTISLVACYNWGCLGIHHIIVLVLITLSLLLGPALLDRRVSHRCVKGRHDMSCGHVK